MLSVTSVLARLGLIDDDGRPARPSCVACDRRRAADEQLLCDSCEAALDADLRAIAAGYPLLTPEPSVQPLRAGTTHQAPGPRSPAVDDVLVLTDPRRQAFDPDNAETRACSLVGLVRYWTDELVVAGLVDERALVRRTLIAGPRGLDVERGRSVPVEALTLAELVPTLARHWSVGELARQCAAQVQHLRRALGDDVRLVPLGRCPLPDPADAVAVELYADLVDELGEAHAARGMAQLAEAEDEGLRVNLCGGLLRSRGWGHPVRCSACGQRWAGAQTLRMLGAMLGGPMFDMPGLVRWLGMDGREATLRKWASRDGWRRERSASGRTVYSLDDALRSWWRAWDREQDERDPEPPAPEQPATAGVVVPLQRPYGRHALRDDLLAAA